jgi:hypothetical protein
MEKFIRGEKVVLFRKMLFSFFGFTLLVLSWSIIHPYWEDVQEVFSWHASSSDWKPHYMKSYFLLNAAVVLILCIPAVWMLWTRKPAHWLIGIVTLDLLLYSQVTMPATVHYPYKSTDYEAYFNSLSQLPDQRSASLPYASLVENYEPKMAGIWRNTATYHKSLSFDGHNQTQFKLFNLAEQNGGLEFAKKNPLFFDVSERIELKKDTVRRPNCLWQFDSAVELNTDTLQITHPVIGFNEFSAHVHNYSKHADVLVLNQNFHKAWSAELNGKPLKVHRANDAFMGVLIPPNVSGKVVFVFDAPVWRKSVWIGVCSWAVFLFVLIGIQFRRSLNLSAKR